MLTTAEKNWLLDQLGTRITHFGLHSAFPGTGGSNEISGGSPAYARKAVTWNAAASDNLDANGSYAFDVPAGTTVAWLGCWSALTTGTFRGLMPLQGASPMVPRTFSCDLTNNKILMPAHGLSNGERVPFWGGTPPAPLVEGTIYFVVNATTDDFQVAATSGGSAIDLTAQADQDVLCARIVPETFGAQGTYTLNDADINLYP